MASIAPLRLGINASPNKCLGMNDGQHGMACLCLSLFIARRLEDKGDLAVERRSSVSPCDLQEATRSIEIIRAPPGGGSLP